MSRIDFTEAPMGVHQVRALRSITTCYSSHDFLGNPNVLTWLLNRPPTTFEQYVRAQHVAFKARQESLVT